MKVRIALVGPPASGKGTQAEMIRARYGIPVVSPGQVLREEMRVGSPLGIEADKLTRHGQLVPDTVIVSVIENWLNANDSKFVFDGFPRTVKQALSVDELLALRDQPLEAVIHFEADLETLQQRVANRLVCASCGHTFSIGLHLSGNLKACTKCGGPLIKREDDTAEVLKRRMEEYLEKTAPVVDHYQSVGLLRSIKSIGRPEEVFAGVRQILEA